MNAIVKPTIIGKLDIHVGNRFLIKEISPYLLNLNVHIIQLYLLDPGIQTEMTSVFHATASRMGQWITFVNHPQGNANALLEYTETNAMLAHINLRN